MLRYSLVTDEQRAIGNSITIVLPFDSAFIGDRFIINSKTQKNNKNTKENCPIKQLTANEIRESSVDILTAKMADLNGGLKKKYRVFM